MKNTVQQADVISLFDGPSSYTEKTVDMERNSSG